jgi:hypothetical protein
MRKWYGCQIWNYRRPPISKIAPSRTKPQRTAATDSLGTLGRHTWSFHRGRFSSKQKATTEAVAFEQLVRQKKD